MPDDTPLLTVDVRHKRYGERVVLQSLQLALRAGEAATLVGASGCGKSTLLRIAAGLETDFEGAGRRLDGAPVQGLTREIGFVFQEPRLFPWLTVAQNVAFERGLSRRDAAADAGVRELLAEVGMHGLADALPKQLSGGQAQRAAIARGLFSHPRLLLLDEPFSAVDAFTRMKLQDLLLALAARHRITLLAVTHDVDEAVYLSDRVWVMRAGPGRLVREVAVPLPRPRDRGDPALAGPKAEVLAELQALHAI